MAFLAVLPLLSFIIDCLFLLLKELTFLVTLPLLITLRIVKLAFNIVFHCLFTVGCLIGDNPIILYILMGGWYAVILSHMIDIIYLLYLTDSTPPYLVEWVQNSFYIVGLNLRHQPIEVKVLIYIGLGFGIGISCFWFVVFYSPILWLRNFWAAIIGEPIPQTKPFELPQYTTPAEFLQPVDDIDDHLSPQSYEILPSMGFRRTQVLDHNPNSDSEYEWVPTEDIPPFDLGPSIDDDEESS